MILPSIVFPCPLVRLCERPVALWRNFDIGGGGESAVSPVLDAGGREKAQPAAPGRSRRQTLPGRRRQAGATARPRPPGPRGRDARPADPGLRLRPHLLDAIPARP